MTAFEELIKSWQPVSPPPVYDENTSSEEICHEELRRFQEIYRERFHTDPVFYGFYMGNSSPITMYQMLDKRERLIYSQPSFFEYFYKSYTLLRKENFQTKKLSFSYDGSEFFYDCSICLMTVDNPFTPIGFAQFGFDGESTSTHIVNFWFFQDKPEPMDTKELLRTCYIIGLLHTRICDKAISVAFPWPDDEYMQGHAFEMQVNKLADAIPEAIPGRVTLVKTMLSQNDMVNRFDSDYHMMECLPNDMFQHQSTEVPGVLMDYLCKVSATITDPQTPLSRMLYQHRRKDQTVDIKNIRNCVWNYLMDNRLHLLLFFDDNGIAGHMEYYQSDHRVFIRDFHFIDMDFRDIYMKDIMKEFLYDCLQGDIKLVEVRTSSQPMREFYVSLGFTIAEVVMRMISK